jgi:20S proteasome alpha/beta subunit
VPLSLHALGAAGVVYSGMGPDFRVLVRKGQKKAQTYYLQYGVRAVCAGPRREEARAATRGPPVVALGVHPAL